MLPWRKSSIQSRWIKDPCIGANSSGCDRRRCRRATFVIHLARPITMHHSAALPRFGSSSVRHRSLNAGSEDANDRRRAYATAWGLAKRQSISWNTMGLSQLRCASSHNFRGVRCPTILTASWPLSTLSTSSLLPNGSDPTSTLAGQYSIGPDAARISSSSGEWLRWERRGGNAVAWRRRFEGYCPRWSSCQRQGRP